MPLLDLFWAMFLLFLWVAWFWLLISVFADIFRSEDLSGLGKAGWVVLSVFLPALGVLLYLVVRGPSMHVRAERRAAETDRVTRAYIREAAGTRSATDELARLAELHASGALTDDEFDREKAKILTA